MIRPLHPEEVKKKLLNRVEKTSSGCWEWTKTRLPKGYGLFRVLNQKLAHRVSYTIFHGPIFGELHVLHKCDNPPCVNPDHLFLGTPKDNTKDMIIKGRQALNPNRFKTHCPRNHAYTRVNKNGSRGCKYCDRIRMRKRRVTK